MIENLEETDTTPYYYIQVGRSLKHNGTDNGWYGHTFNVVKVNGEWYALDTQAGIFLDNWPYVCKRMFNGNDLDLPPFDEDAFYPYDEDGEYRDWKIEVVE